MYMGTAPALSLCQLMRKSLLTLLQGAENRYLRQNRGNLSLFDTLMGWVRSANRLANKPYRQNAGFLQNVNLLKAEKRQFLDFQVENRTKLALSVAPSTRFERVAFRLGGGRSIQLSYEGI